MGKLVYYIPGITEGEAQALNSGLNFSEYNSILQTMGLPFRVDPIGFTLLITSLVPFETKPRPSAVPPPHKRVNSLGTIAIPANLISSPNLAALTIESDMSIFSPTLINNDLQISIDINVTNGFNIGTYKQQNTHFDFGPNNLATIVLVEVFTYPGSHGDSETLVIDNFQDCKSVAIVPWMSSSQEGTIDTLLSQPNPSNFYYFKIDIV